MDELLAVFTQDNYLRERHKEERKKKKKKKKKKKEDA